jgi:hypothetical protein
VVLRKRADRRLLFVQQPRQRCAFRCLVFETIGLLAGQPLDLSVERCCWGNTVLRLGVNSEMRAPQQYGRQDAALGYAREAERSCRGITITDACNRRSDTIRRSILNPVS